MKKIISILLSIGFLSSCTEGQMNAFTKGIDGALTTYEQIEDAKIKKAQRKYIERQK